MNPIVFYTASTICILFILFMIFQKNPVSSAICLVGSFFALSTIYITLDAHFVATLQILIYAGAIMVLFIFVIMLLNLKPEELSGDKFSASRLLVFIAGMGLFAYLAWHIIRIPAVAFPEVQANFGTAEAVGKLMYSKYVVPFEIIGLLLLVGVVGAILLGRRES